MPLDYQSFHSTMRSRRSWLEDGITSLNAMRNDARNIPVFSIDSDVIVIPVGLFSNFHPDTNVWAVFWHRIVCYGFFLLLLLRYYCVNQSLGHEKSKAQLYFHDFTDCDTSQLLNKGKKSAWDAWSAYPEATSAFAGVIEHPFSPITENSRLFVILERFTCALYDESTTHINVNELKEELFSKKSKLMEHIPPTQVGAILGSLLSDI